MMHSLSATCGSRQWLVGTLVLSMLALAGYYFSFKIFFGASFVFGSIAAILAIALYGFVSAVIVVLIGSAYTIVLFSHPYAMVVFTLEVAFIGVFYRKGIRNLVLTDLLFWCTLGPVVVLLLYHNVIGMDWTASQLILFKQFLNGIFNALIASIILLLINISQLKFSRWSSEKPSIQNIFFIPMLTFVLLVGVIPVQFHSQYMQADKENVLTDRLVNKASDIEQSINDGTYSALQKIINLEHFSAEMSVAILGKENQLLASHGTLVSLKAGGEVKQLSNNLVIWLPPGDVPAIMRWKRGSYIFKYPIEHTYASSMVIEYSAASMVESIEKSNLNLFRLVTGLMLLSIIVAQVISHWFAKPINNLAKTGRGLAEDIYTGKEIVFPVSPIREVESLSDSLRIMSSNLSEMFNELHSAREGLETQVKKRTKELEFVNTNLKDRQFALDQHAIVSISDTTGTIIYANENFCNISGYSYDELIGQNHRLIKSDQHPDSFFSELWATISQGKAWSGEICNRRKDGELYWVQSTITPFLDSIGQPFQYIAIRTDITQVKAAEIELREKEERMSLAIEGAGDGIWDWDIIKGTMSFSRLYELMLGYKEHELIPVPNTWVDSVHPDDLPRAQLILQSYFKGEVSEYVVELRLRCKDGSYKWIMCRAQLVSRDQDGQPGRMIGIHTDISERKQSEEKLQLATDRLNRAQSIAKIGSWEFNLNTHELIWSKEHYEIFELSELPSDQLYAAYRNKVHEDDLEQLDRLVSNVKETGESFPYEHRVKCNDGSIKYVLAISECSFDEAGNATILRGTVQDITEHKKSEQILVNARKEADRANKAKSEFLSSMSHELRTPMNAILGFGQLLEMDDELNEYQLENVRDIMNGGHHLLELINEVLDLAKIESGNIDLSLEPVELVSVLNECFDLMEPLASNSNIRIQKCECRGVVVRADRTRLKQSLINMLSNAIKYNKANGSVTVDVEPLENNQIRIQVTDTGHGIAEEKLRDLFEPFNRLDASKRGIEGTGIGLTITRRIVELMGGVIGVKSEVGVGSSFWIELPLESIQSADVKADSEQDNSDNKIVIETQRKVLYIDDNPVNLKLVSRVLGVKKHVHLFTAHTPALGLELADQHEPQLILLDINMPGMNGYEVLAQLKKDSRFQNVPFVALSADAMPQDIERGIAAGFNDYITKPIDIKTFNLSIDRYLSDDV